MPIAISDDHRQLGEVARSFLEGQGGRSLARALLDAPAEELPGFWKDMAGLGWFGLHLPEEVGGSGYALAELAVVVEELGRVVAPGPFLPTVWASAVIAECGGNESRDLLTRLADGSAVGAIGVTDRLEKSMRGISGEAIVLGAGLADVVLLTVGDDVLAFEVDGEAVRVVTPGNVDHTRRAARVTLTSAQPMAGGELKRARKYAVAVGRTLASAEAAGGASACTEMASEYAKVREQFGRVIATYQAVKHHCANMLVNAELATAGAWDAARAQHFDEQFELAAAVAATRALPAYLANANLNVQVHGGIGFTWEHDAHLYLRRAISLMAIFGPAEAAAADVAALAADGVARQFGVELPPEAEEHRQEIRTFRAEYEQLPEDQRLGALLDAGYVMPHWPKPWGRGAGAVEQLVIEEEMRGVPRPGYGIGGWIIQTLTQHADSDQIERWIRPSLEGKYVWCQLFSEPEAGSDAAGIRTKGVKVDGGWIVNGQKVWTSGGQFSTLGLATVRTDPDAPKHDGITAMVIDMKAEGVDVRPLREASGGALFCEIFFNDVFVPDDDVVGPVNGGWKVARSTLGNERVSIGGGSGVGPNMEAINFYKAAPDDPAVAQAVGALIAESQAMRLLNLRSTERAIVGGEPGPEGNVSKLLSGEHAQRSAELGLTFGGAEVALTDGAGAGTSAALIFSRALTIAGGTSEINRNQIGERILGLPRDPLIN
jgi:3-oxochol-4-en-24-oyl-CoA dehydrogenase